MLWCQGCVLFDIFEAYWAVCTVFSYIIDNAPSFNIFPHNAPPPPHTHTHTPRAVKHFARNEMNCGPRLGKMALKNKRAIPWAILSYAICEQQRRRSACACTQSDRHLCFRWLAGIIPILAKSKMSRLQLVSLAEQAGLSLTWSETSEDRFSRDEAQTDFWNVRYIPLHRILVQKVSMSEMRYNLTLVWYIMLP